MAVAHKNLTGTDLHEVKGASTATSGQVPIADGVGGAPFGKLTASSLTGTGNPFGASLLHVREEQASGVSSGCSSLANFNTLILNTIKTNEISGASLASNVISLPAGTYYVEATSCPYNPSVAGSAFSGLKARLRNTTAGTTLIVGTTAYFQNGSASSIYPSPIVSTVRGRFTLAGTANVEFQAYPVSAVKSGGGSWGEVEVYSEVLIWKVA